MEEIGGKGLFVRELDAALREGRVDLTVHSCKDLPTEIPTDLPIAVEYRPQCPGFTAYSGVDLWLAGSGHHQVRS